MNVKSRIKRGKEGANGLTNMFHNFVRYQVPVCWCGHSKRQQTGVTQQTTSNGRVPSGVG